MLRVLVAEDSATTRELLVSILRSDRELQVVAEAKNGLEAVAMTKRLRPDVITMDIRMPLLDGFEATKQIMVEAPTPIVIVSGSVDVREVEVSMHALRVGALTVIDKPTAPDSPDFDDICERLLSTVKSMAQVKVVRHWAAGTTARRPVPPPSEFVTPARIVAIAASTGGPGALCQVLSELPRDFPLPVLVVQHIARGFDAGFTAWLNTNVALRTKVAEPLEQLAPRTIYVAPDDAHLGVEDARTILVSKTPAIGGFRPSATFLFESVARIFGKSTLAVMLTGMGQDGVEGLRAVREAGGQTLAQDEESSIVFGMPGAAVAAGLADAILPLKEIALGIMRAAKICEEGQ